jgi:hypothetical protein
MTKKELLLLDSLKSTNNVFTLNKPISGYYLLRCFVCTNNIYNVTDYNNKIYINENSNNLTATLTNGYYDINDLKTNITTAMNAVCSGTISITIDSNTNKYTFTNDTYNFYFTFNTNTTNTARFLLGFNATDGSNNTTQTSNNPININTNPSFFINILENDDKNITSTDYFDTSLFINGTGTFGEILKYINNDNFDQYIKIQNPTKKITISFHDNNNNPIVLNSQYIIIFEEKI